MHAQNFSELPDLACSPASEIAATSMSLALLLFRVSVSVVAAEGLTHTHTRLPADDFAGTDELTLRRLQAEGQLGADNACWSDLGGDLANDEGADLGEGRYGADLAECSEPRTPLRPGPRARPVPPTSRRESHLAVRSRPPRAQRRFACRASRASAAAPSRRTRRPTSAS